MKQIGNYTYNERFCLGEGAFGKVYEGNSKNGSKVAIKRIDKQIIQSDTYLRASIQSEILILKKFNHPNIVHLEDMLLTTNNIYIITQFCNNGDLKQYLRNKKLNEQESFEILKQILTGFMEIVKLEIVHRDLKPANVLIHQNTFKICDFGFAKYLKQMGKMNKTCVGTPMYMSPQVLKSRPYTNKTDIWSLGILTYEMMFGRTPWQGNSQDNLYKNITSKPLQIPHCSNYIYELIKGMLEIQQKDRWSWDKIFQYTNLKQGNGYKKIQAKSVQNDVKTYQNKMKQPSNINQNIHLGQQSLNKAKSTKNPKFCLFVLTQLYLNPINAPSYNQFLSCLYSYTIQQYQKVRMENKEYGETMVQEMNQAKQLDIKPSKYSNCQQNMSILGENLLKQTKNTQKCRLNELIKFLISTQRY